ncbi:hypothetical protein GBSOP10_102217 [Armatimonadetes bacterium GBS]|jgi:hypothetical protein|nr:hypothetical protein HRbin14_00496 [bacterium HR14]GIV13558.1 MAG: hypothetical protein KatS3mg021_1840 [Fimbriimonadales bacterium]CUU02832.1 hypothetical protein GBSOP10_102217 [Armatimonadetes bacterium GBS]CUU35402.1 hypothetical protein GXSOP10_12117 [Armatimonadetes bacterium GXS]
MSACPGRYGCEKDGTLNRVTKRLGIALMLTLMVWLPVFLFRMSDYAGRYLWSLGMPVTIEYWIVSLAISFASIIYLIYRSYKYYKIKNVILYRQVLHTLIIFSTLAFLSLCVLIAYLGSMSMEDARQLADRQAQVVPDARVYRHMPAVLPSPEELMQYGLLFLALFVVMLYGLSIRQTLLLYLCTTALSTSLVALWLMMSHPGDYVWIAWYMMAGMALGFACASVIHAWRTLTKKNS